MQQDRKEIAIGLITICIFIFVTLAIAGCTGRSTLIPKDRLFDGIERKFYASLSFDDHGRPVFSRELGSRPGTPGLLYHVLDVDGSSGRMTRAFSIALVDPEDVGFKLKRPLGIIYKWTGKGFETGVDIAGTFISEGPKSGQLGAAAVSVLAAGASIIVVTAQGLITGVVKGTAGEIERPFTRSNEILTGYMKFTTDDSGRLTEFIQMTPEERPRLIVKTTYHYSGDSMVPAYAESSSIPENKFRIIRSGDKK